MRIRHLLVAISLASATVFMARAAQGADLVGEQLLSNQGFESVRPLGTVIYSYKGWTLANGLVPDNWCGLPNRPATIEMVQGGSAYDGATFMRVTAGAISPEIFSEPFYSTDAGQCFRMSVWARGSGRAGLFVYEYGDDYMSGYYARTFPLTAQWTAHSAVYFPTDKCQKLRFVIKSAAGGVADYDTVRMVKLNEGDLTADIVGELLHNGGFEHAEGISDDSLARLGLEPGAQKPHLWELNGDGCSFQLLRDRGQAHSGEACVRIEKTDDAGWLHLYSSTPAKALANFDFILTAWLRGTGTAWLGLYDAGDDGVRVGEPIELTADWRECSVRITPTRAATTVHFAVGADDQAVWIDDVSLRLTPRHAAGAGRRDPDME